MLKVAPQTVEPPADEYVKPTAPSVGHNPIQGGPALLGTAHPVVDIQL